jgi:hypothetical protein
MPTSGKQSRVPAQVFTDVVDYTALKIVRREALLARHRSHVAPGGRFLMMRAVEGSEDDKPTVRGPTEFGVVLNWTEELKRIAPIPERK